MKTSLLTFLLGIFVAISFAATAVAVTEVKPVKPKSTVCKTVRAMYSLEDDVKEYIDEMVKKGYIVKTVALMDDENWSKGIIVMEKY